MGGRTKFGILKLALEIVNLYLRRKNECFIILSIPTTSDVVKGHIIVNKQRITNIIPHIK